MKISFITSGHYSHDDRIYYHLGFALAERGHDVLISSSKEDLKEQFGNIRIESFNGISIPKSEKIKRFRQRVETFEPHIIICSEPLPVVASESYRRTKDKKVKIIYDITEWYPSTRFLGEYKPVFRWFGFIKLFLLNIYASFLADAFIFGERYKSRPYRFIFPFTPFCTLSYYPDLKYINYKEPSLEKERIRLSYSGEISTDKGFLSFINVVNRLADRYSKISIEVKLVAWYGTDTDREKFEPVITSLRNNVEISWTGKQAFPAFSSKINDSDIFLELRRASFENNHSLPIKFFYYMTLGRPIIITRLKVLTHESEIDKFGFLTDPDDTDGIVNIISRYVENRELYNEHCANARKLAEETYNWGRISPGYVKFIESL